jgi:peptidoglycan/LPS O-acetylase OafA/YrhL
MASGNGSPPQFTPQQRASHARRVLVAVSGPLLWLVSLVVLGWVVNQGRAVEVGLLAVLASLPLALVVCVVARRLRLGEEREANR